MVVQCLGPMPTVIRACNHKVQLHIANVTSALNAFCDFLSNHRMALKSIYKHTSWQLTDKQIGLAST